MSGTKKPSTHIDKMWMVVRGSEGAREVDVMRTPGWHPNPNLRIVLNLWESKTEFVGSILFYTKLEALTRAKELQENEILYYKETIRDIEQLILEESK